MTPDLDPVVTTKIARLVHIHPTDNVAVTAETLRAGATAAVGNGHLTLLSDVPAGHKVAIVDLPTGSEVIKYGFVIGTTTADVRAGDHLHSHNVRTGLAGVSDFANRPESFRHVAPSEPTPAFLGYRRADGRVGTRNEVWILNTVGCVNRSAERIARLSADRFAGKADGFFAFSHPYGCSQLGDDLEHTRKVLAGLVSHPNAGGVLLLGLGCENNQVSSLLDAVGDYEDTRVQHFNAQDVFDEVEEGVQAVERLVRVMDRDERMPCPASDLVLGLKCGGSDGFSGVTANPLVGRVADRLAKSGGRAILTEVPEMFGAEQLLLERATSARVFDEAVSMISEFKEYIVRHNQPIYENPSPGNKAGGLTTLEEKSLGAVQKGGLAPIGEVLRYGIPLRPGVGHGSLTLLEAPGNDGVSGTAMVASGATVLLFTTGRGTPMGFPAPTIKISTTTALATRKPHWIDFDAGPLLDGTTTMDALADDLFAYLLDVASGKSTKNENNDYREIAIWKEGVTL